MVRIGRQIPHYITVDQNSVEAVFSTDKKYRYMLSMNFNDTLLDKGRDKRISIILKNPSAADERMADATIRKIETFVYARFMDVRQMYILNIFAFRATEPGDLNEAFKNLGSMEVIGSENDRVIKNIIEESDYVILAWGNSSGIDKTLYEERIFRLKMILKQIPQQKIYCISGKIKTIQPLHGLMWGYGYNIIPANEIPGYL